VLRGEGEEKDPVPENNPHFYLQRAEEKPRGRRTVLLDKRMHLNHMLSSGEGSVTTVYYGGKDLKLREKRAIYDFQLISLRESL